VARTDPSSWPGLTRTSLAACTIQPRFEAVNAHREGSSARAPRHRCNLNEMGCEIRWSASRTASINLDARGAWKAMTNDRALRHTFSGASASPPNTFLLAWCRAVLLPRHRSAARHMRDDRGANWIHIHILRIAGAEFMYLDRATDLVVRTCTGSISPVFVSFVVRGSWSKKESGANKGLDNRRAD
jgi:hypothetical protein